MKMLTTLFVFAGLVVSTSSFAGSIFGSRSPSDACAGEMHRPSGEVEVRRSGYQGFMSQCTNRRNREMEYYGTMSLNDQCANEANNREGQKAARKEGYEAFIADCLGRRAQEQNAIAQQGSPNGTRVVYGDSAEYYGSGSGGRGFFGRRHGGRRPGDIAVVNPSCWDRRGDWDRNVYCQKLLGRQKTVQGIIGAAALVKAARGHSDLLPLFLLLHR